VGANIFDFVFFFDDNVSIIIFMKVLTALLEGKPVVTHHWLQAITSLPNTKFELPLEDEYLSLFILLNRLIFLLFSYFNLIAFLKSFVPEVGNFLDDPTATFKKRENRKTLFRNKQFICFNTVQYERIKYVESGGGVIQLIEDMKQLPNFLEKKTSMEQCFIQPQDQNYISQLDEILKKYDIHYLLF